MISSSLHSLLSNKNILHHIRKRCAIVYDLGRTLLAFPIKFDIIIREQVDENKLDCVRGVVSRGTGMKTGTKIGFGIRETGELKLVEVTLFPLPQKTPRVE